MDSGEVDKVEDMGSDPERDSLGVLLSVKLLRAAVLRMTLGAIVCDPLLLRDPVTSASPPVTLPSDILAFLSLFTPIPTSQTNEAELPFKSRVFSSGLSVSSDPRGLPFDG